MMLLKTVVVFLPQVFDYRLRANGDACSSWDAVCSIATRQEDIIFLNLLNLRYKRYKRSESREKVYRELISGRFGLR